MPQENLVQPEITTRGFWSQKVQTSMAVIFTSNYLETAPDVNGHTYIGRNQDTRVQIDRCHQCNRLRVRGTRNAIIMRIKANF